MLRQQLDIFYHAVHNTERLPETQKILDEYRDVLSESLKKAYDYLMEGKEGTAHEIGVDRSRFTELRKAGFQLSKRQEGRFVVWSMNQEQREHNRKRMIELTK